MTRSMIGRAALLLATCAISACGRVADVLSPGHAGTPVPARVALATRIATGRAQAGALALRARTSYVRADGSLVPIGEQQAPLADVATQQVPLTIELATCLADPARRGATANDGADATCDVTIELALLSDANVVDRTTVGPLRLRPGATTAADPVTLFEVGTVTVVPPGGPLPVGGSVRVVVGASTSLATTVTDAGGDAVSGHTIVWTSDAPNVARVDAAGVVTGVAPGHARITATVGVRSGVVDVTVAPPTSVITIAAIASGGSGTVRSSPAGIDCRIVAGQPQGACTFAFPGDAQVTLTSTPDAGSATGAWAGACTGTAATCVLVADAPRTASAGFSALRQVTVTAGGTGVGTVVSAPGGITCQATAGAANGVCTASFPDSTTVTLTATPSAPQAFQGWGGDCASASGPTCTLSLAGGSRSAIARFAGPNALTTALTGTGGGSVSLAASGAPLGTCTLANGRQSGICSALVAPGAVATLVATPDAASTFGGWTGACAGTTATTCQVTLDQASSVGATFTARGVSITVGAAAGSLGSGTIAGTGGLACTVTATSATGTCRVTVAPGTPVTLTATAGQSSTFAVWGGACLSASGPTCVLAPTTDVVASAAFDLVGGLDVVLSGGGTSGQVDVTIDGALVGSCQVDSVQTSVTCSYAVRLGTTVSLAASPSFAFFGWSAPCDEVRSSFDTCVFDFDSPDGTAAFGNFGLSGVHAPRARPAPNGTRKPLPTGQGLRDGAPIEAALRASGSPASRSRAKPAAPSPE